ncbi:response regulator transcription factor [Myroides injenensis]|uniref:response regulator transcription factor n=1 Tax=Myroides injenensis TaxID=1183151 RepID=UPI00028907D4|nr:response regulator transcription factor [Myroides injenensis]
MIRIAVVDDHKLFRKSFLRLLSQIEDVEVLFDCSNGIELFEKLKTTSVDIVFLDIQMPIMDGYQVASLLEKNHPEIKILVLTSFDDSYSIERMLKYNIAGYLTKNISFSKLKTAIYGAKSDGIYYDNQIQDIVDQIEDQKSSQYVIFSDKEIEIIKLYAMQYTVKQIAEMLNLSTRTIEKYKETLMQKTDSKNFIGVILFAMRWHYIEDSDLN